MTLTAHYDPSASGGVTLGTGVAVAQLNDLSGNGRDVKQVTAGSRPDLVDDLFPSLRAGLALDGTDDWIGSTGTTTDSPSLLDLLGQSDFTVATTFIIHSVATNASIANNDAIFSNYGGHLAVELLNTGPSGQFSLYPWYYSGGYRQNGVLVADLDEPYVGIFRFTSGAGTFRVAGMNDDRSVSIAGGSTIGFVSASTLEFGRTSAITQYADMDLGESRFYDANLTDQEADDLMEHLVNKWCRPRWLTSNAAVRY